MMKKILLDQWRLAQNLNMLSVQRGLLKVILGYKSFN